MVQPKKKKQKKVAPTLKTQFPKKKPPQMKCDRCGSPINEIEDNWSCCDECGDNLCKKCFGSDSDLLCSVCYAKEIDKLGEPNES
jgi:hypothetical protein